ncbi:hypothetical protein BDZ94DRAFT_1218569 [Collybia nuda]|uniref:Uncharacterized protein n=1 Tax=Collybia nuda TaxID=64659 RepID=A0A9P5Y4R8_9AGAR|nr:hypothetical protein BDZ94DRAFT_1218569 [Collybia nuda]
MPVLASFISYRPGRKPRPAKSVNSPFAVRQFDSPASPHPYASPSSHVLDINDGGALAPNRNHPGGSSHDYYRDHQANGSNQSPSPQVRLNLDINREPLTNWFPESLLNSDLSLDPDSTQASGSGTQYHYSRDTAGGSRMDETTETQESSNVEDDVGGTEGDVDLSSAEDVLADLKAMDASDFVNHTNSEESGGYPALAYLKKSALSPIKIPSLASHGPKVQLLRSADPSRPTSEASSLESPANSGTTLLRELMSNPFALSEDLRTSKYRSGTSNLTRSDSATLPRGEFAMLHSPYWRDRTYSGGELTLSPGSAPPPPVPVNAELVYVPPKTVRQGSDHRERRRVSSSGSFRSDPLSDSVNSATTQIDSADLSKVHRISRITEDTNSLPNTPQPPAADIRIQNIEETAPSLSPEEGSSQAFPTKRESDKSEKSESYSEGPFSPGQRSSMSDAPSSGRDIDNVLDYYSFPDTSDLGQDRNFRPAFSPISEESTSQLSPPAPFRGGKVFVSPLVSPASPNGRMGFDLARRLSENRAPMGARPSKQSLLPIGERPRSQISTPPAPSSSNLSPLVPSLYPIPTPENSGHLAPPASRVFIRERAGATPSPIKVIRDSHDLTAYNITVTPLQDNSVGSTPTTGDSDLIQQDFPETPNAFSPLFSASGNPSPGMRYGHNSDFIPPVPQTPMSARLPTNMVQPTLAQQMLLTRAATSVRHSRQASLGRVRMAAHPYARPPSVHDNSQDNGSATSDEPAPVIGGSLDNRTKMSQHDIPVPPMITTRPPSDTARETPLTIPTSTGPGGSLETSIVPLPASPALQPSSVQESASSAPSYHPLQPSSARSLSPNISGPSGETGLVSIGMGAGHNRSQSIIRSRPSSRAGSTNLPSDAESSSSRPIIQQRIPPSPKLPPPAPPQQPLLNVEDPSPPPPLSHMYRPIQPHTTQAPTPAVTRPPSTSSHGSQGSPPPYCSIAPTGHAAGEALTPSTSGSYDPNFRFGIPPHPNSPHINTRDASSNRQPLNSHTRARGKPAGPRRPSQQHPLSMPGGMRERGGSFSSVASGPATGSMRRLNSATLPSPKFQTPEPKWRGYTMDAAKWTFTSTQLQAIVSRAIRQSSEASSIRLLPLDILDNEMPAELETLEIKRTEMKTKYRALARRRGQLLEILASHADGPDHCTPVQILRLVEDLKDVCASLDRWAVELHSADEQIAQLLQLRQAHFGSALAMALRKMNASFLKQFSEAQALRQQVNSLEAQLDKAWKQAEDVANEYDELRTGKISSSGGSGSGENRYSRISAVRKSSLRASKAGLWSGNNRLSQRSSVSSSNKMGLGQPPSARTTLYSDDIPPVPPIPRRRPENIVTDAPLRSSIGASTSGITPTSETRALVRAQEELYEMLGIGLNELRPRRSRSVTGLPGNPGHTQHPNSPTSHPHDVLNTGRRASLPGSPLPQPSHYNTLTANVSIMLTADREGWI